MKVRLLALFICVQISNISAGFYCTGLTDKGPDEKGIVDAMKNKCITEDNYKQFSRTIENLSNCISDIYREYPVPFDPFKNNEDYCSHLREDQFRSCIKNFTTNISPCLAGNEIYLDKFLRKAGDFIFDELCGKNGISNMQYIYDTLNVSGKCMEICAQLFYGFGSCNTANLYIFKQLDKGVLNLSKNAVCRDLESLQKCIPQVMEGVCNADFSRFLNLVFHPFLESCYI